MRATVVVVVKVWVRRSGESSLLREARSRLLDGLIIFMVGVFCWVVIGQFVGQYELNQGDRVYVGLGTKEGDCVVGYVDKQKQRAYTAKHCGKDGEWVYLPRSLKYVGKLRHAGAPGQDLAYIDLFVKPGENSIVGGAPIPLHDVAIGDEMCLYRESAGSAACGSVEAFVNARPVVRGIDVAPTDDGGPMWITGKGFLGVLSKCYRLVDDVAPGAEAGSYLGVEPLDSAVAQKWLDNSVNGAVEVQGSNPSRW
ncbi:hypothetical protein [Corynebacterium sp. H113]|uniref:hypothetical protein n=1 Tax=Corynebacterium sp. H113 TaxID=3133419 RepID=UPI003097AB1E